jgi:hypothetical protein
MGELIEQDYIMLIMNCKKYVKKAKYQKMTWLRQIPDYLKYYHVIGDLNLDCDYKFDHQYKILWLKVADDYNSLPKKVIKAYEAALETFAFKYLFKTDDDQILVNNKFLDIIKGMTSNTNIIHNPDKKIHYGGYIVDVKQNYLSQYHKIHPELPEYLPVLQTRYCSGRFYFLSNRATSNLVSKKDKIMSEYLEDYAIGFNLDPYYKTTMIHLATNNYFTDIELSDFPRLLNEGKI